MTEQEFEIIRLKMRIAACEVLLQAFYSGMVGVSPDVPKALHKNFQLIKEKYREISLKGYPAEYSDLMAGEFQDAFADILDKLEKGTL